MKVLLISDIHSNIDALRAIWAKEADSDCIVCVGDLTDWGMYPHEVIAWCREHRVLAVAGNHDRALVKLAEEGGHLLSCEQAKTPAVWNVAAMTDEDIDYLRGLPDEILLELDGITYYITHTLCEEDMHVWKKEMVKHRQLPMFEAIWKERVGQNSTARRMVFGHSHQCCLSVVSRNADVINPGSVSYRVCEDAAATGADYMVIQDGEVLVRHVDYPTAHIHSLIDRTAFNEETKRILHTYYASSMDGKEPLPVSSAIAANGKDSLCRYQEYGIRVSETCLESFDRLHTIGWQYPADACIDEQDKREGSGCLSMTCQRDGVLGVSSTAFRAKVYDLRRVTLKFWIYVNDMTLMEGDKGLPDHGTIYVRVSSGAGDDVEEHGWNHTIEGTGWQEVEMSFTCNNTYYAIWKACEHQRLNYFRMFCYGRQGLVVKIDDLRLVEYDADYERPVAPHGGRWISTGDVTALDGVLLTEFFGATMDPDCKAEGITSLRTQGTSAHGDYRLYVGGCHLPVKYREDVLCFSLCVADISRVKSVFIELNQHQDIHEYEREFTLQEWGYTQNGVWQEVYIPLTAFDQNFCPSIFGNSENILLENFRFCVRGASQTDPFDVHIDRIYIAKRASVQERMNENKC